GRRLCRRLGDPVDRRPVRRPDGRPPRLRSRPLTDETPTPDAPKREVKTLYVAEAEDVIRLDRWFRRRWPHLSNIQVQKMARSGQIRVDGGRVKPEARLTAGAAVRVPPIP